MARIPMVEPHRTVGETHKILTDIEKTLGGVPNFVRVLANSQSALAGFHGFFGGLMGGKLDPQIRERIALAMAEANTCQYCVSAHTALADQAGLNEDEIRSAREGKSSDPKADAAVKFARLVLDSKGDVTTAELNEVRDAGFDEGEIQEIIGHVAINTWTNFLGKVGQIDIDFPEVALLSKEQVACAC